MVTGADLHYEGSVTIDRELMDRAGLIDYEAVHVWNINNGERFETYVIPGERNSGVVCINGAAAHKVSVEDLVIIAAFGWMNDEEAQSWKPSVCFVDERNRPVDLGRDHEVGGQQRLLKVWPRAS
jgi:aspartate 1-decarboxylase